MQLRCGPFQALPGGGGQRLALRGDAMAAAGDDRLVLWRGGLEVAAHAADRAWPGWPRWVDEHSVCWGDGQLGPAGWSARFDAAACLPPPRPGAAARVAVCAWAGDGSALLLAVDEGRASQVLMIDPAAGRVIAEHRVADVAPRAAWAGRAGFVLGTRTLPVWSRSGRVMPELAPAGGLPALRLEASADEALLMALRPGGVEVWDLAAGVLRGRFDGDWADAVLLPSGRALLGVDGAGALHAASVDSVAGGRWQRLGDAGLGPIDAIACDERQIVVLARQGAGWHRATVQVED